MLERSSVKMKCYQVVLLLYLGWFVFVEGQDENITATFEPTFVYSPGFASGNYGPNENYHYRITTNYPGNIVRLTPVECGIEHSDKFGCADKLIIYDGYNESADELATFCCVEQPMPTLNSTGGVVYMVFKSDSSVEELGFKMSVISAGQLSNSSTSTTTLSVDAPQQCPTVCVEYPDYTGVIMGCTVGTVTVLAIMMSVLLCFFNRHNMISQMDGELLGSPSEVRELKSQVEQLEVTQLHIDSGHHERSLEGFENPLRASNGHRNRLPPVSHRF